MTKAVLAVDLCHDLAGASGHLESGLTLTRLDQLPAAGRRRSQIERQRDSRAIRFLYIAAEILAMSLVKWPLIASTAILIEDVRKTEPTQEIGRRKPKQNGPMSRLSAQAFDDYRLRHSTFLYPKAASYRCMMEAGGLHVKLSSARWPLFRLVNSQLVSLSDQNSTDRIPPTDGQFTTHRLASTSTTRPRTRRPPLFSANSGKPEAIRLCALD